jgi:hypothetical protein
MLAGLDQPAREQVWQDLTTTFAAYEGADGYVGPCELLVAGATNGADG